MTNYIFCHYKFSQSFIHDLFILTCLGAEIITEQSTKGKQVLQRLAAHHAVYSR